uniref:Interleukin 17 receptor B n=1 Tax=Mus musculus TaxID=10090 RepID=D6REG3_MOUSE
MLLVLLILAASCRSALPREPTIQCGSETGPSPEWMVQHTLTPGDLRDLQVELVKTSVAAEEFSILMNISWILRADASIRLLKATKICVSGKNNMNSYSCVRCNYTEAFQSQTRPSGGKWTFSYVGFPVELSTLYLISAHNIPNANMNEDSPSLSVNFTSPGCTRENTEVTSGVFPAAKHQALRISAPFPLQFPPGPEALSHSATPASGLAFS